VTGRLHDEVGWRDVALHALPSCGTPWTTGTALSWCRTTSHARWED
jgi:hypothetical protein